MSFINFCNDVLHFQFLLASSPTTVQAHNYNIDDREAQAPLYRFCQPMEIYNPNEIKGIALKVVTSRPHLTFL